MTQIDTTQFTPYADPALPMRAPNYTNIDEANYVPHVKDAIAIARQRFDLVRNNPDTPTYANTITALEHCDRELDAILGVFYNLLYAESTDTMQAMAQDIAPITTAFSNDIGLDPQIFARIDDLYSRRDTLDLNAEQAAVLEKSWIGFVRNGAKLNDADKEKLREIDEKLSKATLKFADNARLSANSFEMIVEDVTELTGLPDTNITAAKEAAEAKGHKDSWLFNLDYPSYIPFITYVDNRDLREKMWRGFSARGFGGDHDNQDLVKEIVSLRIQRAQLLGYQTHADYQLERRMAESFETVDNFLDKLCKTAKPTAEKDFIDVKTYAQSNGFGGDLKPWDMAYWSERLKKAEYNFDEELLRPYFKLDNVIEGVFKHAEKLLGVICTKIDTLPTYHSDVTTYEVKDLDGTLRGILYADFHPRPSKKQGAWQSSIRGRATDASGEIELPLVAIVMNFTKPTKGTPSLLNLDEVETLFHEFGHALHSLLTDINEGSISGTSVFWDFVELPSQIMENWLYETETLNLFARHYETGELIPTNMIEKLNKSKHFMRGWFYLRQIMLGRLDLAWHMLDSADGIDEVVPFEREAIEDYSFFDYEGGCTSCSFTHIFSGGYSGGYYSYLWAEVLDADAFEAFQENGLYDRETGQKFRHEILARGGVEHPAQLYRNFRDRDADPDALLRREGLIEDESKQVA